MRWLKVSKDPRQRRGVHIPLRKSPRVSLCDATHCSKARALQTRFDAAAVNCEGFSSGYTEIISCRREVMTPTIPVSKAFPDLVAYRGDRPKECHIIKANSGTCSLFLLNSINAVSLELPLISSATQLRTLRFSSIQLLSIALGLMVWSPLIEWELLLLTAMRL